MPQMIKGMADMKAALEKGKFAVDFTVPGLTSVVALVYATVGRSAIVGTHNPAQLYCKHTWKDDDRDD